MFALSISQKKLHATNNIGYELGKVLFRKGKSLRGLKDKANQRQNYSFRCKLKLEIQNVMSVNCDVLKNVALFKSESRKVSLRYISSNKMFTILQGALSRVTILVSRLEDY